MLNWIAELVENSGFSNDALPPSLRRTLRDLLHECDQLYLVAASKQATAAPRQSRQEVKNYEALLRDLRRGLLMKTLIVIANCDRRWSAEEKEVARVVLQFVWNTKVDTDALAKSMQHLVDHADQLKWRDLVQPFVESAELHEEAALLRSVILRLANLIAKADGEVTAVELAQLEQLKRDLREAFQSRPPKTRRRTAEQATAAAAVVRSAVQTQEQASARREEEQTEKSESANHSVDQPPLDAEQRVQLFDEAMGELNSLVGLEQIKSDIAKLVNFLKVQQFRREHDLPVADISFHAIFEGNPGTGKTTVARILSRLLCGLEILTHGQTIEVDRSGLVAQYAGQTGPRTNERIDEAMGGVLFIDEAYSLVSGQGDDTFGTEAVQTLLKRMEDCRDQFVVIIAGYPDPMNRMLQSNPGLSSRFQRTYRFEDYTAMDLLKIFHKSCEKYHYRLPKNTQRHLLNGFQQLLQDKDEHFGNGRVARNLFEHAITHMSSRIVAVTPLTRELLTTLEPEDIVFDEVN